MQASFPAPALRARNLTVSALVTALLLGVVTASAACSSDPAPEHGAQENDGSDAGTNAARDSGSASSDAATPPADQDGSASSSTCAEGLYCDDATGLEWENAGQEHYFEGTYANSETHCADLVVDGRGGFRIPDIHELLTLVRGCEAASECVFDDEDGSNLHSECACDVGDGPGDGGMYLPDAYQVREGDRAFLSVLSTTTDSSGCRLHVHFNQGWPAWACGDDATVFCVRDR